jgi:hypothetical protein
MHNLLATGAEKMRRKCVTFLPTSSTKKCAPRRLDNDRSADRVIGSVPHNSHRNAVWEVRFVWT